MSKLSIRPALRADLAAVLALYAQPDIDDGEVLGPEEAARIFERFSAYPDYTLYVAEQDGTAVGSFALLIMDNLGHFGAPSGVVEHVVVNPGFQDEGIGTAMMRFAARTCRDRGCYKLALSADVKRKRAYAFFERLGFQRHGYSFLLSFEEPGETA
ncbi:MAG: GNAT family N-acetyltransferase [Hyphomicrobiales bacterium]|nr:GNAT family N-acetyltransferase [Hyphomicrobiales bacterium]